MSWLMVGIYLRRSVHLSPVALKIPGRAKVPSITRRLTRFLDNPAIRVREWFEPIARAILQTAASTGGNPADGRRDQGQLWSSALAVSLAFRRRAIPIAWTGVKTPRGPRGFRSCWWEIVSSALVEVIQQLEAGGWQYALRQKASHLIRLPGGDWQRFGDVIREPGKSRWLGQGQLTREHGHPTNWLAHWEKGENEPWLLATNLSSRQETLKAYRRRMWVEEMFGDLKGNGLDLESGHLIHCLRLSRLTLAVVLLYVWLARRAHGSSRTVNGIRWIGQTGGI
jgi:hypothetical protein